MDSWWNRLWDGLLYVLLAAATVVALADEPESPTSRLVTLAVVAMIAAWHSWWIIAHPEWVQRAQLMLVYFAGLIPATAVLVARDPAYLIFSFILYIQPFVILPTAFTVPVVAAGALSVLAAGGELTDADRLPGNIGQFVLNVGLTSIIGLFVRYLLEQGELRKKTIQELEAAHARLETSAAANAELQAQLLARARDAGVLDERHRLAREIHDTLAQGLAGIVTKLEAAENALDGQRRAVAGSMRGPRSAPHSDDVSRRIHVAKRLARESLTEARRSVDALRPAALESSHLPEALATITNAWSAASGVEAEAVTTGTAGPMHPEVEVTLLRTAQEALANVAKHAAASHVALTLSYMGDVVSLDVRDDGVGFDPRTVGVRPAEQLSAADAAAGRADGVDAEASQSEASFGLTAMRERITRLGGSLVIETAPGRGAAICASVPATPAQVAG